MSPEAIALRCGLSLKQVRDIFTKIQEAFNNEGIVVNDSVYAEDPISCYEEENRTDNSS